MKSIFYLSKHIICLRCYPECSVVTTRLNTRLNIVTPLQHCTCIKAWSLFAHSENNCVIWRIFYWQCRSAKQTKCK